MSTTQEDLMGTPQSNGASSRDEFDTTPLRAQIEHLQAREDEIEKEIMRATARLVQERADVRARRRRYERALIHIEGTEPTPRRRRRPGQVASGISDKRVDLVHEAINRYMNDHEVDEVRQVDIRARLSPEVDLSTGAVSLAFEQLKQRGVIRLARRQKGPGGGHFYRMTPKGMREVQP